MSGVRDWRLPENRRECFQRFYSFHLKYKSHPGCVYSLLPAIADDFALDADGRAWLAWLNGNTQNPATSLLLLEASDGDPANWRGAVDFWNDHFKQLEWDTDRRHQKGKFGEATEMWAEQRLHSPFGPAKIWQEFGEQGWTATWAYARSLPYFGRLSAWSGLEFARILLGNDVVPDAGTWLLEDRSGSRSHRNGLAVVAGYDAWNWDAGDPFLLGIVDDLAELGDELLGEAQDRNLISTSPCDCAVPFAERCPHPAVVLHPDVSRLTMESALCTYKSWHKPNRRYPNVYADMAYLRIKKAESRFGERFQVLWDARARDLPDYLRLECNPNDPGLSSEKQNHYLETGCPVMMHREWPDDMDDGWADQWS